MLHGVPNHKRSFLGEIHLIFAKTKWSSAGTFSVYTGGTFDEMIMTFSSTVAKLLSSICNIIGIQCDSVEK